MKKYFVRVVLQKYFQPNYFSERVENKSVQCFSHGQLVHQAPSKEVPDVSVDSVCVLVCAQYVHKCLYDFDFVYNIFYVMYRNESWLVQRRLLMCVYCTMMQAMNKLL